MIDKTLQFLAEELNKYLIAKGTVSSDLPRLVIGNVAKAFDNETAPAGTTAVANRAILSLVNTEEDKISKQQENYRKSDISTVYKSPPVYLNLYILIAVNRNNYTDSLTWLGHIIQFFQHQQVFTPITYPSLNSRIEKLVVDMYSMNFEQINHLWSTLGGKYLPSVLYKVRQITIDEELTTSESGFIKEIQMNEKSIEPVSS